MTEQRQRAFQRVLDDALERQLSGNLAWLCEVPSSTPCRHTSFPRPDIAHKRNGRSRTKSVAHLERAERGFGFVRPELHAHLTVLC